MTPRGVSLLALAAPLLAVGLVACATAPPIEKQRWIRIRSEHFEVLSSAPQRFSMELARDLERFHAFLAGEGFRGMPTLASRSARVVVFGDEPTFRNFRRHPGIQGYMTATGDGTWLVVNAEPNDRADSVAFHEFVHLAEQMGGGETRPPWYREGLAEFLSTTRFGGGSVEVGRPPLARKRWLERGNPLPLHRVMLAEDVLDWDASELQTFYAQAWALVHFFRAGHLVGEQDRSAQLAAYLHRLERGEATEEAFEAAFGQTFEEIELAFLRYLTAGRMSWRRIPFAGVADALRFQVEVLSPSEQLSLLADLAFQMGEVGLAQAERLLRKAGQFEANSLRNDASLARVLALRGDPEAAGRLRGLASREPREAAVLGRIADGFSALSRQDHDDSACETAVELYERSLVLEPGRVASLHGWARCLGGSQEELARSVDLLERARAVAPHLPALAVALASRQASLGDLEAARESVRMATRNPHLERDDPKLTTELRRVSKLLGVVPDGPVSTRHLSARLEVETPRHRSVQRSLVPFAEVAGRAGLSSALLFDVVIAIDQSGSTLAASGMDVDRDGVLGTSRQTVYGELFPSSDPGDEVQAAELIAATRLVQQLHAESTRVAIIGFGADATVEAQLGAPKEALAALARMRLAGLAYQTDGTSLGNALAAASDQFVAHRDAKRRERAIVLLSDGFATWPDPRQGRQHALDVAVELREYGVRVHAYLIGALAPLNDDTYAQIAHLTSGRFVPVPDPIDVIARLSNLRLTGLQDIAIRNLETGAESRALRIGADGTFDAWVELAPGINEIEVVAQVADRAPLREVRRVDYGVPEAVSDQDRREAEVFMGRLKDRGEALGAHAEVERRRHLDPSDRRVEIELSPDGAAAPIDPGQP